MAFNAVTVPVNTKYNDRGLKKAEKELNKLGKTIDKVAVNALKASANFVFLQGGRALFDFGAESVTNARDLERNLAGIQAVFGDLTPSMVEFTKNAYQLGLSQSEAAQATTFLGSVLKQSGFDISTTAELTKQLIALGTDLAIVYGYDVQEALLGMTALFRGEYDPIEKFGVAMKQSEIDAEKARLKIDHLTGANERYADQLIRVKFFMERAADSQGQFQEQGDSLFAQQRILNAEFENMKARIGEDLTPVLANLASMIRSEVLPVLGPMLQDVFARFITFIQMLIENKDTLIPKIQQVVGAIVVLTQVFLNITTFIAENIRLIATLGGAMITFYGISKGLSFVSLLWKGVTASINLATGAQKRFNVVSRRSIAGLLGSLAAVGVGMVIFDKLDEGLGDVEGGFEDIEAASADYLAELDEIGRAGLEAFQMDTINAEIQGLVDGTGLITENMQDIEKTAGGAADALEGVANFYNKLYDEAEKQAARVKLQSLGATEGLIDAVLGSGDQWRAVFASVVQNGIQSVREVQNLFAQTKAGFDEAMAEWEQNVWNPFEQWRDQALQARDAMLEFISSIEILPTINRELGKFEQAASNNLERIEEDLEKAFDNEYLLEESYKNLLKYARDEFAVLQQIERQRDELMARRDAAANMIESVNESIVAGARIVDVLRNVENAADNVDIASIVKKTVQDSRSLKEFEVIVTSAVVEPIEEVVSKSQQLVEGYRGIVERTRAFVTNMKALRELGLDPTLFNDLVEAGVDAGGATAEALIEGGTETVTEVNNLFAELNALGAELGEETAQVMYGQGENFVDGIVKGLEAQASQLEEQAKALAEAFTTTFEDMLIAGIEAAIAAAEAALAKMPKFEGMPGIQDSGRNDDEDNIQRDPDTGGFTPIPFNPNLPTTGGPIGEDAPVAPLPPKSLAGGSFVVNTSSLGNVLAASVGQRSGPPQNLATINVYSSSRADASSVAKQLTTYSTKNNSTYLRSTAKRNLR